MHLQINDVDLQIMLKIIDDNVANKKVTLNLYNGLAFLIRSDI